MAKEVQRMNGFVKKFHSGFSLIEIIVVIALLALVSAIVIPRIKRQPLPLVKQFEQNLNGLLQQTKTNAMATQKLHRIFLDHKNHVVRIDVEDGKKDSQGKRTFKSLEIPYVKTSFPLDENLTIDRFTVNGKNFMSNTELSYYEMWFYITQDGICQEVEMVLVDQQKKQNAIITINPFFCKAELS